MPSAQYLLPYYIKWLMLSLFRCWYIGRVNKHSPLCGLGSTWVWQKIGYRFTVLWSKYVPLERYHQTIFTYVRFLPTHNVDTTTVTTFQNLQLLTPTFYHAEHEALLGFSRQVTAEHRVSSFTHGYLGACISCFDAILSFVSWYCFPKNHSDDFEDWGRIGITASLQQ